MGALYGALFALALTVSAPAQVEGEVSGVLGGTESGEVVGMGGALRLATPGHMSDDEATTTVHRVTGRERYELTLLSGHPVLRIMGRIEFYPVTIQGWQLYRDHEQRVYLGLQVISATVLGQFTVAQVASAADRGVDVSRSYVSMSPQLAASLVHVGGMGSRRHRLPVMSSARVRVGGGGAVAYDRDGLAFPSGGASFGADGTMTLLMHIGNSSHLSSVELGLSYDTMVGATDRYAGGALHTFAGSLGLYVGYLQDRALFLRAEGRGDWFDVNPAPGVASLDGGPVWFIGGSVGIRFGSP